MNFQLFITVVDGSNEHPLRDFELLTDTPASTNNLVNHHKMSILSSISLHLKYTPLSANLNRIIIVLTSDLLFIISVSVGY